MYVLYGGGWGVHGFRAVTLRPTSGPAMITTGAAGIGAAAAGVGGDPALTQAAESASGQMLLELEPATTRSPYRRPFEQGLAAK